MSLSVNFSRVFKILFKLQKCKFTRGKTREGCALISKPSPSKNMRASALCFAFFSSNQIPFALCTCPLSPECAFRAAQTCHDEDTQRGVSHRVKPASQNHLHFCFFLPLMAELVAYQQSVLSLCLFFTNVGFSWKNRPLRMCKLRSRFGGISPDQGGLKLSELDKWARERPWSTVPGWPHTELWQARHG